LEEYQSYSKKVRDLLKEILQEKKISDNRLTSIHHILNGESKSVLEKVVSPSSLKKDGVFFTGEKYAHQLVEPILGEINKKSKIIDINCGTADLLLPLTKVLPIESDLKSTLKLWGNILFGQDIHEPFVDLAKSRIAFSALMRTKSFNLSISEVDSLLPNFFATDSLTDHGNVKDASHIILNPPFTKGIPPLDCQWANGKVNSAAIYFENCIRSAQSGTRVIAILPEVLRSGSLYENWRQVISSQTDEVRIELLGQFSKSVDIDVFILDVLKTEDSKAKNRWNIPITEGQKVGDYFDVSIGKVVEYRDPKQGLLSDFIKPKSVPAWSTITKISSKRKFQGSLIEPPFVVVRRTSRKEERFRATASIVNSDSPVAVENHFIVLKAKEGGLKRCHELFEVLQNKTTNDWLNQRIRCRHLTKNSVQNIPWDLQ